MLDGIFTACVRIRHKSLLCSPYAHLRLCRLVELREPLVLAGISAPGESVSVARQGCQSHFDVKK